jgi:hypothetical protein
VTALKGRTTDIAPGLVTLAGARSSTTE